MLMQSRLPEWEDLLLLSEIAGIAEISALWMEPGTGLVNSPLAFW